MKVAIVCDWLVVYAGAERVIEQLLNIYPQANLFCVVDFLPEEQRGFLQDKKSTTTFVQKLPLARKKYRSYLPLMPLAIEQLDVTDYDLVISSSTCVAKGIITGPNQVHISYTHSPVRYAWDLTHQYLRESGLSKGIKGWLAKLILHYIRLWDYRTANGVDAFVANSHFIARRIKKVYGRDAKVIYPPVDVISYEFCEEKENYYITASRLVPYKKVKLIVDAFNQMPDKKLIVIGDGPDFAKTKAVAGKNIIMMGYQPFDVLKEKMQHAKAFVFAAEEDFGITPVEAQACGTPVIAYGRGGALETVKGVGRCESPTGVFFDAQTVEGICDAVRSFEIYSAEIKPETCRKNAEQFSIENFSEHMKFFIEEKVKEFKI
ncbi:MAG: glycosyltransferase family 4 protein [Selenomonas sp.]|uniref:glycosyltransferase family 4 protein n=1 Tax=Selenomonas sp. TaxID=2053611 RepID=UPI0025CBF68C|nr:glycosyltransferase family 4 protein [Selenomonas sp.]MCR5439753.1 glycosyltransferase family 4 protein [Selenomonas sp.]